jgi:protein disulfide-isomerase
MVCGLLAVPAAAQEYGVRWQADIESAKTIARQTGRLVLVHFWTPNCGPCLSLEQNVFNQPGVAGALESHFVPVKLNANAHPATAIGFGITRVPTDVILTADGQVVDKRISPPTSAAYVAEMSQVAAQHATRLGQAFTVAASQAPVPAQLKAAPAPPAAVPSAAPISATTVANAIPAVGSGAQSVSSGAFQAWNAPPSTATGPVLGAPSSTPAATTSAAIASHNPYIQQAMPTNIAPQASPAPQQVTNSYAAGATSGAPTSPVAPGATIPDPAAAMNAAIGAGAGAAVASSAPDRRALPPNAPPLGFEGYCPVSMRNHWKWLPGDPRWGVVHRGRTYWFVGPSEQQLFWADPDRYSPALSGMDPVLAVDHRQQVPGKREHSLDYDNLFYMFASEATLQQFSANPQRYATSVRQAMGIPRGRLVQ